MNSKGLFTQILLIVLAVAIVITYILPTFDEIKETQDNIVQYKNERAKIDEVNNKLAALVQQVNDVPSSDQNKLLTYIPDEVDSIAVARIIKNITEESGVSLEDVTYTDVDQSIDLSNPGELLNLPVPHSFSLEVRGTYEQIKNTLTLLEQNEFPLEVRELDLSVMEGNFMSSSISLMTYSRMLPAESSFGND